MHSSEVLDLIDNLRARGVQSIRMKQADGFELEVVGIPPLIAGEIPESPTARQALLKDPGTPESLKEKLRAMDDEDLFASA